MINIIITARIFARSLIILLMIKGEKEKSVMCAGL